MSANKLLEDANRLWKMLDEMSENDPAGYRKFINSQMASFHKSMSPPIVRFVVKLTQTEKKQPLIVNFCEWSAVPEPKSPDSPVPVKCGDAFIINEVDAITLAFNPTVFVDHSFNESLTDSHTDNQCLVYSQMEHDNDRYQLIWLGLNYLEKEKFLPTIESNSVTHSDVPMRPKLLRQSNAYGSKEQVYRSVGFLKESFIKQDVEMNHQVNSISTMTSETLTKLKNAGESNHDDIDSYAIQSLMLPSEKSNISNSSTKSNDKILIEEINDISINMGSSQQQEAKYISWSAEVIPFNLSEHLNKLKLIFKLPGLQSGKQCDVNLTKNRILLKVVDTSVAFQPLDLRLPCNIDVDSAEAKFNLKKGKLIIFVSILSSS
ncbi:unnamed protein product [Heterobilharzia americana]|nr:unnamed protein product [Heterobilharzia americana]